MEVVWYHKGGVYTSQQQATLTRGPVATSTCHHWVAHPNGRLSQHREQQHTQNRRAVRDAAPPAKTAARQPQWNHRLQLDMQGIAQLPASCATGIRCRTNDAVSIHGGFEGAPRSGELPGLAAHSIDRAAAGWMVELCVEEWRCSLLYTFFRDHGGIVHGEAADAERVLRTGSGADGARYKLVEHAKLEKNETLTHDTANLVTSSLTAREHNFIRGGSKLP